ncbi:MAG: PAS domain S-box protein, partial [Gemmatimonadaceae bacterium]
MAKESRILMVEDDANDAALIDRELRRAGVACTTLRAASEPAFRRALHEFAPDIILVDNSLPGLNAGDAIRVASAEHPDTPVIVVTGSLDETIAAQYVQAGANDFILKHNLSRLGPAVQRALMLRRARLDRRHAEQAMRASEQRYRRLVEYSSDVITLIDGRGVITYSSESLKPTLGYAQGERTGHNVLELIHADDRAVAERLFQEVATEPGRAAHGELRVQHKNGSWRDLEVVAVNHTDDPVVDAVVVNYHDVTERKRVEAALRDSEERLRQLAEHISEAFFVTDVVTESPLYVSPAWATIWGRPPAQALDAHVWFSSVHPDDQPKLAASRQATLRGETSENVFRILRPDGVTRWVRGRSYPV